MLLGQAMECAGMIGEAVGRTRFKSDGLAIMATLTVSAVLSDLPAWQTAVYGFVPVLSLKRATQ